MKRADRAAPWLLGIAIVLAAVATMYFGRGSTFTFDELVWVVASPHLEPSSLFQSHGGHLQLIPRAVYKVMLETVGLEYWPYRLLTFLTTAGAAVILFRYLLRRVPPAVALAPCLILLFFGSDPLHSIRGNGFTIVLSVLCGVAALMLLDRSHGSPDAPGPRGLSRDIGAALLLGVGLATYTVTLPFVVGAGLLLLLTRGLRSLWIPLAPLALYGIWRIWLQAQPGRSGSSLQLSNVTDLPKWIFDSLSATLSAITGLGYGFTDTTAAGPDGLIGPVLAALFLAAIAWCLIRGPRHAGLWVALAIGFTLWTIQCLSVTDGPGGYRAADEARYLYPGAVVVVMIGAELCAGRRWSRPAFVLLWAVCLFGLASNISQMREYGAVHRSESQATIETVTTAGIFFTETAGRPVPGDPDPVNVKATAAVIPAMAARPFGGIEMSEAEILDLSEESRASIDRDLAGYFQIGLAAAVKPVRRCSSLQPAGDGTFTAVLSGGGAVIAGGDRPANLSLGRFAAQPEFELGLLPPRALRRLELPGPVLKTPWRIAADRPGVRVCQGVS